MPDDQDIIEAAKRLVSYTSMRPPLTLDFDTAAREQFYSYGVMFNTRANQLRKGADADAAAEECMPVYCLYNTCMHECDPLCIPSHPDEYHCSCDTSALLVVTCIMHHTACIGPWKLGMLSACLFLWDILWQVEAPSFQEQWQIKVCHHITYINVVPAVCALGVSCKCIGIHMVVTLLVCAM